MARVYLSAQSPEFTKRTWSQLIELVAQGYDGATAVRWLKFAKSAPLKVLANIPIYQTEAVHILAVQNRGAFRFEYGGGTLRENLGLSRPTNRFRSHI